MPDNRRIKKNRVVPLYSINAARYYLLMILSYRNKETEQAAKGIFNKRIQTDIRKRAKMRLDRINAAVTLDDLRVPPSHNLEMLQGDRKGQHSIRINKQWRICFNWEDGAALNVEITDYH